MTKVQVDSNGKVITLNGKPLVVSEGGVTPTGTISISENGTYNVTNYASAEVNVAGSISNTGFSVRVVDYDGTPLKSAILEDGDTFTLPSPPSHEGLVFKSWSSPVTITNNTVTISDSDIIIGAVYDTESELSEFDILLTPRTKLTVTLDMDGTKNWGDGTSDTETTHTYSSEGEYTITCNGTTLGEYSVFGQDGEENCYVRDMRLMNVTSIPEVAFYNCYSLRTVTIPDTVESIGSQAFYGCHSLASIVIPSGVTNIGDNAMDDCNSMNYAVIPNTVTTIGASAFVTSSSLISMVIPSSVTSIGDFAFGDCYTLTSVTIPSSVESLGDYVFQNCYSLKRAAIFCDSCSAGLFGDCVSLKDLVLGDGLEDLGGFNNCKSLISVKVPSSVTNVNSNAFSGCFSLTEYDFSDHTTIPTLANSNVFSRDNYSCKIYVPANLYDSWIVAENWSELAEYHYIYAKETM